MSLDWNKIGVPTMSDLAKLTNKMDSILELNKNLYDLLNNTQQLVEQNTESISKLEKVVKTANTNQAKEMLQLQKSIDELKANNISEQLSRMESLVKLTLVNSLSETIEKQGK